MKKYVLIIFVQIVIIIILTLFFPYNIINNFMEKKVMSSTLANKDISTNVTPVVQHSIIPPIVNTITNLDTQLTGKADPETFITVKQNNKIIGNATTNKDGYFILYIPIKQADTELQVTAIDATGNESNPALTIVKNAVLPEKMLLDVPLISQMPELPRGCEVTSLAMLLNYMGINVNKMTLAEQVKKDPTPYHQVNNKTFFGNPNDGFVGDMYNLSTPGLGVYHGPIYDLANTYRNNHIIDLTGSSFDHVLKYVASSKPVWVINTATFRKAPKNNWETWQTPTGQIDIIYGVHSVIITGYDSKYIYFNDPLTNEKNRKVLIQPFKEGWEQLGKQAITYY